MNIIWFERQNALIRILLNLKHGAFPQPRQRHFSDQTFFLEKCCPIALDRFISVEISGSVLLQVGLPQGFLTVLFHIRLGIGMLCFYDEHLPRLPVLYDHIRPAESIFIVGGDQVSCPEKSPATNA